MQQYMTYRNIVEQVIENIRQELCNRYEPYLKYIRIYETILYTTKIYMSL